MSATEPNRGWMPLTPAQLDFWQEFCLYPDQPISTVAHYIDIRGEVDRQALAQAITLTIGETEAFALRFAIARRRQPLQRCDPAAAPPLRRIDVRHCPDPRREALRLMRADVEQPLDLLRQPLAASWLIRVGDARYFWYIRAHHIVIDGYGMTLIEHRCAGLYAQGIGKGDGGDAFYPFARCLAEEREYGAGRRCADDRRYWRDYLAAPVELPVLHKGGEDYGADSRHFACRLSARFSGELQRLAERCDIGWPDLLLALSGAYLFYHLPRRSNGDREILPLWVPFMNRRSPVAAYVPALLVNILPLFIRVAADENLLDFLRRTARELHVQRLHGRYRIERIAADRQLPANSRYFFSPLVNVLPFDPPCFAGCRSRRHVLASGPGDGFNITWRGHMDARRLSVEVDADPALLRQDEFIRHRQTLPEFMRRAVREGALTRRPEALFNPPDPAR
ncbi:condensation domain-containing protein [Brenneria tiliae]|uniref:condensation domain-containing protein n=1 Tax=Brenneria tiliae TaxID=2914984 RepID=UPI0020150088|nr:condensation domain-containing protein [Brenneria tiliae]MCL2897272.1 condensation domain-containing protein [Brenneria tiliae]MCL2901785.1 condensation domain-containing protein [Brenneria tiliae]